MNEVRDLKEKKCLQELEHRLFHMLSCLADANLDYREICAEIVDQAKRFTQSEDGYIAMIDPDSQDLNFYIKRKTTDPSVPLYYSVKISPCPDRSYPDLHGHAVNSGTAFFTNDPPSHPSYQGFTADHIPKHNLISVPVHLDGKVAGVITLGNSDRDYSDEDIALLHHICKFFALVIKRWLYESMIRNQKMYLQAIIDNSKDQIWALDRDLRLTALNCHAKSAFERICQRDINIGDRALTDIPEYLENHWRRLYDGALDGSTLNFVECSEYTKYEYHEFYVAPITTDGLITGVSIHSQNVSDYVRSDKTIRALYNKLQQTHTIIENVMNNIPAIILVISLKTYRILFLNDYAKKIYGNVEGEICYEKCHVDKTAPCEECPINELNTTGNPIMFRKIQYPVADRWYLTTSSLINWTDNDPAHLQIAIDMTERVIAEKELERTTAKLHDLNATKDKFFSIIAHDLKSPFLGIFGFAEMIHDSCRDLSWDELEAYSEIIANSAKHTHDLLQNLLVWSQTQTDGIKFHPIPTDISALIEECVASHQLTAMQKRVKLETVLQPMHKILIDGNLIRTVIRNLLSNAILFSNPNGRVRIEGSVENRTLILSIIDYGEGMSAAQVENLFKIECGASNTYDGVDKRKGSGLGLIICREFVTLHNGSISVSSKLGQGSTFRVTIPLNVQSPAIG